jgi:hypothetical protein
MNAGFQFSAGSLRVAAEQKSLEQGLAQDPDELTAAVLS